ncbi:MAG: hypothetical protein HKN04_03025, partial [Rhodothermaceae bacterium]|nr:hypothetical protein [Rhodothermaceae bacterium]
MRNRYGTALLPLLLGVFMTLPAQAQDDAHAPAISAVTSYFQSASARFGTNSADVSDLVVTNAYVGRRSGATHVYLRQAHNGIPIINAPAQAVVTRTGEVFAPRASFTTNVAARVNAETPSVLAEAAASNALQRLQRIERPAAPAIITLSDAAGEILAPTPTTYPTEHFEPQMDLARLVYVVQD